MERSHQQATLSLSKFQYAFEQLQRTLRPVLSAIDTLRSSSNEDELDAMSRAHIHITLAYAINSLFCMYLRTQGIDPTSHPIAEEIARVQDAFMRMRKVEAGLSIQHQPPPNRDRRRHIANAKKAAAKLAAIIYPEEDDLVRALQGRERTIKKQKSQQQNDQDNTSEDKEGHVNSHQKQAKSSLPHLTEETKAADAQVPNSAHPKENGHIADTQFNDEQTNLPMSELDDPEQTLNSESHSNRLEESSSEKRDELLDANVKKSEEKDKKIKTDKTDKREKKGKKSKKERKHKGDKKDKRDKKDKSDKEKSSEGPDNIVDEDKKKKDRKKKKRRQIDSKEEHCPPDKTDRKRRKREKQKS